MVEHNTETEEIKAGEISQEAMMVWKVGTTKHAKGAKGQAKLFFKDESYDDAVPAGQAVRSWCSSVRV
jgi:hypothetical protein